MMPFGGPTPSEADLKEALIDAAAGDVKTDQGFDGAIIDVLLRVLEQSYVHRVDIEEAMRFRQVMEDEENIAEAEANVDRTTAAGRGTNRHNEH